MAMSMTTKSLRNDLFSSLVSDIKSYSGKDPLLPWLRGIKKMKETFPPNVLKEKLPRFLQKCTETFESDRRYRNDVRYLRVWLQLMDFVDEPRALLRTMEMNSIGKKRSLFYQAYALYYEKMKKFEEAEKMYHLGVQNLSEPIDKLQKSYEQFLHRMERHSNKRIQNQERRTGRRPMSARKAEESNENACTVEGRPKEKLDRSYQNVKLLNESFEDGMAGIRSSEKNLVQKSKAKDISKQQVIMGRESDKSRMFHGEDTVVVVKFVDTAIVGKSEAEDACHHGLVDPTINMKEAMNAINSMFREPIETVPTRRSTKRSQPKEHNLNNGFNVFIDEDFSNGTESLHQKEEKNTSMMQHDRAQTSQPHQEPLQIYIENEENGENGDGNDDIAFVFPCPKDLRSENSDDNSAENSPHVKLREDAVVHRFVGSTILDEPAAENVCHHGLVDPTINLKEAMEDINNMFGKPIDFVRSKRPKKQEKAPVAKQDFGGFSILPDDDFEQQKTQPPTRSSRASGNDLFEPTMFTKEALDDINKMFGMPLDF